MKTSSGRLPEGWSVVHRVTVPGKEGETFPTDGVPLGSAAKSYREEAFPAGLSRHQVEAVRRGLEGSDVCVTTRTASAKSLPFYLVGLESILDGGKVLAVYPLKVLGQQEEHRWSQMLGTAAPDRKVGRIDGSVPRSRRPNVLRHSSVVVMTPDIIHAWLLPSLGELVSGSQDVQIILEVSDVIEVPGKSSMELYNLDTGEIEDLGEGPRPGSAPGPLSRGNPWGWRKPSGFGTGYVPCSEGSLVSWADRAGFMTRINGGLARACRQCPAIRSTRNTRSRHWYAIQCPLGDRAKDGVGSQHTRLSEEVGRWRSHRAYSVTHIP